MDGEARRVTLLICDDHKVLTDALATVVGLDETLELVAPPVHDAETAVELCTKFLPDVVLMDIVFKGGMSGIDATRAIKEESPSTKVVIMTAHDEDRLLAQVARERAEQKDAQTLLNDLTDREREILQLLSEGTRNDDIAAKLYISPQTVQTHVRNILGKLRVHSKLEAVAFAVRHGAITV